MRIILAGFGTVAQSLARILNEDHESFMQAHGFKPSVVAAIDSHGYCVNANGLNLNKLLQVKEKTGTVGDYPENGEKNPDGQEIITQTEAEALIETTPTNFRGAEPGMSNIKKALATGKHVVTSNKGPLALALPALLELAQHRKLRLRFSGTVGAGTPFLDFAKKCLPGERITGINGILNGTTNYVLTRMEEGMLSFDSALAEAQQKGYAESDPSNDVDGLDTAAKVVIIANWVLKRKIHLKDLHVKGIRSVSLDQVAKAKESGKRIKLMGRLEDTRASVQPEEVPVSDPVCVPGSLNALTYSTMHAGRVTLVGQGAGGEQTASALIRDLVDIRREYLL